MEVSVNSGEYSLYCSFEDSPETERSLPFGTSPLARTRRKRHLLQDAQPHFERYPAKISNCTVYSDEQAHTMLYAAQGPSSCDTCPRCQQFFTLKRTLVRHMSTVLAEYHGAHFVCNECGVRCTRKDILNRHMTYQHSEGRQLVECEVCHERVRPRSFKGHQTSDKCKRAGREIAAKTSAVMNTLHVEGVHFREAASPSLGLQLLMVLCFVRLSALLFVQIQPWGCGPDSQALWAIKRQAVQSYEIRRLKTCVIRALRTALSAPDVDTDSHLFDALMLIIIAITMVDGWDETPVHQNASLRLASKQIYALGTTDDVFVNMDPSPTFYDVLYRSTPEYERGKCREVIRMSIRMMRESARDQISYISHGFSQSVSSESIWEYIANLSPEVFLAHWGHHSKNIADVVSTIGVFAIDQA